MSDSEWANFKKLGGAGWLRKYVGGMPDKYYEVFQRPVKEMESAR